jgi:pimeloyl-ACP methyl ester carboxylesterase
MNPIQRTQGNYEIEVTDVAFGSGDAVLNGRLLFPSTGKDVPGAIICHGFGTGYRTVESSARMLASRGIAVLIFDFRGHGNSDGVLDGNVVNDVIAAWNYLTACRSVDCTRIAVAGHSMGAMAAILAAGAIRPHALIALSCPPELNGDLSKLSFEIPVALLGDDGRTMQYPRDGSLPWLTGAASILSQIWMRIAGYKVKVRWAEFARTVSTARLSAVVRELRDCEMLFVHCRGDGIAPSATAVALYESASGPKDILISEGGFHSTPLLAGKVRRSWTDWAVSTLTAVQ